MSYRNRNETTSPTRRMYDFQVKNSEPNIWLDTPSPSPSPNQSPESKKSFIAYPETKEDCSSSCCLL
jgi:hypothetical protein